MEFWISLLLFYLLFCCGQTGLAIGLALIVLFLCAITESWWLLWTLLVLLVLVVLCLFPKTRCKKQTEKTFVKRKRKNEVNKRVLLKLAKRMPAGRLPSHTISQSDVANIVTEEQWDIYIDWFRKFAGKYVVIGDNAIRAKGKPAKSKLVNLIKTKQV